MKSVDQEEQLRNITTSGAEIVQNLEEKDAIVLNGRIDDLVRRWENFTLRLRRRKERY